MVPQSFVPVPVCCVLLQFNWTEQLEEGPGGGKDRRTKTQTKLNRKESSKSWKSVPKTPRDRSSISLAFLIKNNPP
jgi:hypothetical protein